MQSPEPELSADPNLPDALYRRIREQTAPDSSSGSAGTIACICFVLAAFVLVLLLEAGADLQELLLAVGVIAALNLVAGVAWVTVSQRSQERSTD
jgi:cobalamin biosynthesis protein CobD/CbiB